MGWAVAALEFATWHSFCQLSTHLVKLAFVFTKIVDVFP
jgi:hypothetical protein